MIELPFEVIAIILGYLPPEVNKAIVNPYYKPFEVPDLVKIGTTEEFLVTTDRFHFLEDSGSINPITTFPNFEAFVKYYNTPPYRKLPKEINYYETDGVLFHRYYLKTPEDFNTLIKYRRFEELGLAMNEFHYDSMKKVDNFRNKVKTIDFLRVTGSDFDASLIKKHSVKKFFCKVTEDFDPKKFKQVQVPLLLTFENPISNYKHLPTNLIELSLVIKESSIKLKLSHLIKLTKLSIVIECPSLLKKVRMSLPDNIENLTILNNKYFTIDKIELPKKLKSLNLEWFNLPVKFKLPPMVEEVLLYKSNLDLVYPKTLKTARFDECRFINSLILPTSLESLEIYFSKEDMTGAPKMSDLLRLKKLIISTRAVGDPLPLDAPTVEPIINVPANVELFTSIDCRGTFYLNTRLKTFNIQSPPGGGGLLLGKTPESVKFIRFYEIAIDPGWMLSPNLLGLTISGGTCKDDFLKLPDTLKFLEILAYDLEKIRFNEKLLYLLIEKCVVDQTLVKKLPKSLRRFGLARVLNDDTYSFDFSDFKLEEINLEIPFSYIEKLILPSTIKILRLQVPDLELTKFVKLSNIDLSRVKNVMVYNEANECVNYIKR